MICFLIVTKKERCCVWSVHIKEGERERRRETEKERGSKKGGTETHGANSFDSSARASLSLIFLSYMYYIYMFSLWRRTFARVIQTLVPSQLFAIAMATFSCWVHRRWFVSRHSAGSVAYIISFVLLLSLLTLLQVLFNTPSAAMYLLRNLI
jgi:hypothetical protein